MDKRTDKKITRKKILGIFKKTGAFQEGHFLLSSGLHSKFYFQCAQVLQYPRYAKVLCCELAKKYRNKKIDAVIGPAYGGIIVSYEVARCLNTKALFTERQEAKMCLRRNFSIYRGERILIVEDVITTGGSICEVINLVKSKGAKIVGIGALIDRSARVNFGLPARGLIRIKADNYPQRDCPLCKNNIPLVKPGSKSI